MSTPAPAAATAAHPARAGLELVAGPVRLADARVPEPVTTTLPERFVASAWVAPAVLGAGSADRLQGVLAGTPADDDAPHVTWTLGLDRDGRAVVRVRRGDAQDGAQVDVVSPAPLRRLVWAHLAAELGPDAVVLRVDGDVVGRAALPPGTRLDGPTVVHLGRAPDAVEERSVRLGFLTGLVADAAVHAGASSALTARPEVDPTEMWRTDPARFDGDRDRPRFHFVPPAQWMNEPHGILHHGGRHHLYYQRNELGPFWGAITWGHAVSDDLVHWTDLGSALVGADIPDAPDGIWSGSAVVDDDGTPLLFFTAGDFRDDPNQRTAWARPSDLTDPDLRVWTPGPAPVTTLHDALPGLRAAGLEPLPREFRDPFVWRDGDTWFQVVGAGIEGRGGTALLFRAPSATADRWEFVGPLALGDARARPDTGVMWELPVLLPVGDDEAGRPKHALFVTPWWPEPCEHSLLHEWYWVGTWDAASATWTPDHEDPRELDLGGFFTGVTGSVTPDGRTLLWTIAQDLLPEEEHTARGWAGNAGLPVTIRYADGDLRVAPVEELTALREVPVVDLRADASTRPGLDGSPAAAFAPPEHGAATTVAVDVGPMVEVDLEADVPVGGAVEVAVRAPSSDDPAVLLTVARTTPTAGRITVRRPGGMEPHRTERGGDVDLPADEPVRVRVLVDHSMVEAYVQDRRSVTTRAWARPGDGDRGHVAVTGGATLRRLTVWPLRSAVVAERLAPT